MRAGLFWLNDKQRACVEPNLPTNLTGPERDDDRRIISGIIHMLQCGTRWRDCPPEYGPYGWWYRLWQELIGILGWQDVLLQPWTYVILTASLILVPLQKLQMHGRPTLTYWK